MRKSIEKAVAVSAILFSQLFFSCGDGKDDSSSDKAKEGTQATLPKARTPQEAYAQLVTAVKSGNYGAMYDLMDSANRNYTRMWFDLNLQQLDMMDSAERAGWTQFKNITDPRQRFIRLVEVTPPMRQRFVNGYRILSVDTVVALVTQNVNSSPQLTFFRWEDGGYRYTAPPESKIAPAAVRVPTQKPPAPGSGPEGANKR